MKSYGPVGPAFESRGDEGIFLLSKTVHTRSGDQPAS